MQIYLHTRVQHKLTIKLCTHAHEYANTHSHTHTNKQHSRTILYVQEDMARHSTETNSTGILSLQPL